MALHSRTNDLTTTQQIKITVQRTRSRFLDETVEVTESRSSILRHAQFWTMLEKLMSDEIKGE